VSTHQPKLNGRGRQAVRLWLQLLTLTTLIEKRIRKRLLSEFDTTLPRFDVLASLDRAKGRITMGELSRRLLVSKGNVTGVVTELERQGLVIRQRDSYDKRTHYLKLTTAGVRHFRKLAGAHRQWVTAMFKDADDKSLARLYKNLGRVKSAITAQHRGRAT
jgi:DNA-binding MarR family transcriptional regulator